MSETKKYLTDPHEVKYDRKSSLKWRDTINKGKYYINLTDSAHIHKNDSEI